MCKRRSKGCKEYHQVNRHQMSRRSLLGYGGGLLTALAVPSWLPKVAMAADENSDRDVLVSVFLRGGADSLSLCVPHLEDNYYTLRPTLAVPRPDSNQAMRATDLDGRFGLAPAMTPLLESFQAGDLAFVQACGMRESNRSHFDSMFFMEVGQGSPPANLFTGWLGRHLQSTAPTAGQGLLRAVGLGFGLPRTLVGGPATLPIEDLSNFDLGGDEDTLAARRAAIEEMYAAVPDPIGVSARTTFDTIDLLRQIDFTGYLPAGGAQYPNDEFGVSLQSAAALIRADVGVEAIHIDVGGWDTHENQGPLQGEMSLLMASLAQGLAAFHRDMDGANRNDVTLVAQSEFGRNVFENGSRGTDHGFGGAMLALGKNVQGGRVVTEWPGLADELLYEGQDLPITIDNRDVLTELLQKRLASPDYRQVFSDPTFTPVDRGLFA